MQVGHEGIRQTGHQVGVEIREVGLVVVGVLVGYLEPLVAGAESSDLAPEAAQVHVHRIPAADVGLHAGHVFLAVYANIDAYSGTDVPVFVDVLGLRGGTDRGERGHQDD